MTLGFDPVGAGIRRCPFLSDLAANEGERYARNFATNPWQPAGDREARQPIFQELEDFTSVFRVFHGPQGIVPLANKEPSLQKALPSEKPISESNPQQSGSSQVVEVGRRKGPSLAAPAPAASLSLANFGFLGDFFNQNNKRQKKPRKNGRRGSQRNNASASSNASSLNLGSASASGQCPLRKYFGPLATMVMSGRYKCPAAVVQMRAMISKTPVVRTLRPESLPIKILAVMAVSSALNIPFGALRVHMKKFSPEWFLVVHATIPLIAMFRKSVIMPKYAMAFTVAAAIGGQMVGARLEKRRIRKDNWGPQQIEGAENSSVGGGLHGSDTVIKDGHGMGRHHCASHAKLDESGLSVAKHGGVLVVE